MDPEQIYQEVLQEEQAKGSSAPVAEGRAKAARQRATKGSPDPKQPRWWPGSQPHLEEGGGGEAAAEAPAEQPAAEQAPAEQPAAEQAPAEQAPAEQPAAEVQQPAAEVAVAEPAADAPREAAAQAAVQAGTPPPEMAAPERPMGVTHGTSSGTRLRPEDAVASDAQFEGERAIQERRKLIDDLVATGVPAVTAADAGARSSPMLAVAYLLIPLVAVLFLVSQRDSLAGGDDHGGSPPPQPRTPVTTLVAQAIAFDKSTITAAAGEEVTITLDNEDSAPHNFSVFESEGGPEIVTGDVADPGASVETKVPAQEPGTYFFRCDLHPSAMTGDYVVE